MSFFEKLNSQFNKQNQQEIHFKELDDWVTNLIQLYFGTLIKVQVKYYGGTEDLAYQDYLNLFALKLSNEADPTKLPTFLEEKRQEKLPKLDRHEFRQALRANFLEQPSSISSSFEGVEKVKEVIDSNLLHQTKLGKDLPTNIISALIEVVFALPTQFFATKKDIPKPIQSNMITVLRDIENKLRRPMQLDDEIFNLDEQFAKMIYENGKATGSIKLPLISLINAPLTGEDLGKLYARQNIDQEARLGRQILRSTGVVLIAGYRGVGKSTFVNKVLHDLETIYAPMQVIHPRWHVIPVHISLAKATNVTSVLRYCIRTLHNLFLSNEDLANLLYPQEKQLLQLAYLRATYRFAQEHSESAINAIDTQASLKITLGDFIGSKLPLPSFESNVSRAWNQEIAQTIGLLDYDEDQAENDISIFIEQLARERSPSWLMEQQDSIAKIKQAVQGDKAKIHSQSPRRSDSIRVKLVFVFDEMDKMDEEEGQMPLVRQLKNLFLSRYAVFLLLTSKKFYYRWLRERQQEDSVLNSYFSSVTMVPMFTTEDTLQLLRKISKIPLQGDNDPLFLETFAQYLNYRSMGIPREILRELYEMQQWLENSLQPYLTNHSDQFGIVKLYAEIQAVLEELDDQARVEENNVVRSDVIPVAETSTEMVTNEVNSLTPSNGESTTDEESDDPIAAEVSIASERYWRSEGLREQIRRGRYVLVEQLLADGQLEWSESLLQDDKSRLYQLYQHNFGLLAPHDFLEQINKVAVRLQSVFITTADFPVLVQEGKEPQQINLVRRVNVNDTVHPTNKIIVDDSFYEITKRSRNQLENSIINVSANLTIQLSDEEVGDYLSSNSLAKKEQALGYLSRQEGRPDKQNIQENLYRIFTSKDLDTRLRISAGKKLDGLTFIRMAKETNFEQSLQGEQNAEILKQVVDLIREGSRNVSTKNTGRRLLITLIKRGSSSKSSSYASLKLSKDFYGEVTTLLVDIGATEDSLALVVQGVEKGSKIPASLFSLLISLQQKSPDNLLELLVVQDIRGLQESKIRDLISTENNILELWSRLLPHKDVVLARQVMSEIIAWLAQNPEQQIYPKPIIEWLSGTSWVTMDSKIIENAMAKPRVPAYLEQLVKKSEDDVLANTLAKSRVPKQTAPVKVNTPTESTSPSPSTPLPLSPEELRKKRRNRWLNLAGLLGLYAIFVLVPINLPADVTVTSQLMGRFLEFAYLPLFVLSVIFIVWGFSDREIFLIGLGIVFLFLVGVCFYVLIAVLQQPLTLGGQVILSVINAIGLIWMFVLVA